MDIRYMLSSMINFAAEYCMAKCVRTMIAGMLVLPLILLVRKCNRARRADINFYAMLMLVPAAFTGMSRFFFLRYTKYIPVILYSVIRPIHGKIYFGVMAVLLGRYFWKNHRLGKRVRALPVWGEKEELRYAAEQILGITGQQEEAEQVLGAVGQQDKTDRRRVGRRICESYLKRVKVYVTREAVSPFSGGLLRPYVVLPEAMLTKWPEEERRAVLCHELVHIKSGHILWTAVFQLLKIYWWVNPVIYLCDRLFREDMEMVCDEQCIRYANVSCGAYGRTLLNMIALMQDFGPEGTLCFSDRTDFQAVKKRIEGLAAPNAEPNAVRRLRRRRVIFAGAFIGMFALIAATSYPRYTKLDDLVLYDGDLNMLDYDSEELRSAVRVESGRLWIDEEKFSALLARKEFQGEYVYVSFDTIMKIPGSGGCGNVGMVAVADCSDIFYLASDGPDTWIEVFWLKYLI